jgi:arylsulfatase A-like enzyme
LQNVIDIKKALVLAAAALLGISSVANADQNRPNILWLSVEDISSHLHSYGYKGAVTPNLDKLAAEGIQYNRAYASAPVCAVARSSIINGVYSASQGSQFMRTKIKVDKSIKPFTRYLQDVGYFTSNRSKTDYQFTPPEGTWNKIGKKIKDWHDRKDPDQPFFSVINYGGTHESKNRGEYDPKLFNPKKLDLPPYYPDSPKTRKFWASYYQNIHDADLWVKEQLDRLEADGLADNTIVVFWSDHGVGFPRGKRWAYESGLRVPMIVRIPEKWRKQYAAFQPGSKADELVNFIDFAPTMLSLAGAKIPDYMQGRVFLGEKKQPAPEYLFGHRDRMDERVDIVRTVIGKKYKYIRNFEYYKPHQQYNEYPEINPWNGIMAEIRRLNQTPNPPENVAWYFQYKPTEELYDLSVDPHEMINLAGKKELTPVIKKMREKLSGFQYSIGDLGAIPESILRNWRDVYGSEYAVHKKAPGKLAHAWKVLQDLHRHSAGELESLTKSENEAVRYWAAVGLGNLAYDSKQSALIKRALQSLFIDDVPVVRAAAARGVLLVEDSMPALNVLKSIINDQTLQSMDHLEAMRVVDVVGRRALPLKSVLQSASSSTKYPGRVRDELMSRLDSAPPRIPKPALVLAP